MDFADYRPVFAKMDDQVETQAYTYFRRFSRLGNKGLYLPDHDFKLNLPYEEDLDPHDNSRKKFRDFTGWELAELQLGSLVAMKMGGLSSKLYERYTKLRDLFIGTEVFSQYYQAKNAEINFDPDQIKSVVKIMGEFFKLLEGLDDIDAVSELVSTAEGEAIVRERRMELERDQINLIQAEEHEVYTTPNGVPCSMGDTEQDFIKTIEKIDRFLLSRM